MKCPKCHAANSEGQRFCGECGAPLAAPQRTSISRTKSLRLSPVAKGTTFAGRYRILEELGRGGMGIVYKAQDLKLERPVALKFLASELTQDREAKERFVQEARAASALDHPNICTIHEIDEAKGGRMYITMGFCDGESLREKIERGRLDVDEAVSIARQVAEGLGRAHAKGIVHRDIKPANIMITADGRVKIVDFGLAKLAGQVKLTRTGTTVGTVAYMSPEQARGEETDHRSDIWSLGVMLYEMLAGRLPFQGETSQGVIYSILNREPELPGRARPGLPAPVGQVILRALEKDRSRRYPSVDELLKDLKVVQSLETAPLKAEKSIIVLPFENISPDPDQEYFCDGMTEEIITDLSHVRDLLVISRSSAMTFKGTKKTIPEIARAVNVRYVLEGSVRKSGNNLRITAQLIDSLSDTHLWAEKYTGTLDDIFEMQENMSRSIVDALKVRLDADERHRISVKPIDNFAAYECYLRAYHEIYRFTEEGRRRALKYLEAGLAMSGDNALLYSTMAFIYWQYWIFVEKTEEVIAKAEEYIDKALALDPECAKAYAVRGWMTFDFYLKSQESVPYFKRALAIHPNEFEAVHGLVRTCIYVGKIKEAVPLAERMIQIDPLNPVCWMVQGGLHYFDGRFDLALEPLKKAYQMAPDNESIQFYYASSLARSNLVDDATSIIDRMAAASPRGFLAKSMLMVKHALLNNRDAVFREMTADFQETARKQWSYSVVVPMALIGARKEALDWLEYDLSWFFNYPFLAEKDPFLANIRNEPRFRKLMERVKYEWERFEV